MYLPHLTLLYRYRTAEDCHLPPTWEEGTRTLPFELPVYHDCIAAGGSEERT